MALDAMEAWPGPWWKWPPSSWRQPPCLANAQATYAAAKALSDRYKPLAEIEAVSTQDTVKPLAASQEAAAQIALLRSLVAQSLCDGGANAGGLKSAKGQRDLALARHQKPRNVREP